MCWMLERCPAWHLFAVRANIQNTLGAPSPASNAGVPNVPKVSNARYPPVVQSYKSVTWYKWRACLE
eukprot:8088471-Lingulodinium_polyedra.AAC.1